MVKGAVFLRTTALTLALLCANVGMVAADVLAVKSDAPQTYVVKKGDTLWDISNIFLSKPWLWPELWRNNTQIENPHLIYPGDQLFLRYEDGNAIIEMVRAGGRDKGTIVLTPAGSTLKKPNPISTMPWAMISHFIANDSLMDADEYDSLPTILGDNLGSPRFSDKDYVLAKDLPNTSTSYQVVRKVREVTDSSGKHLGLQIQHLSEAEVSTSLTDDRYLVQLTKGTLEAKQGDKLKPASKTQETDLKLSSANEQVGEIVQNINGNSLIGLRDVVIVNLGKQDVTPGTVFGIYKQGPDIIKSNNPTYSSDKTLLEMLSFKERVEQPAFKVGELVIVKSFDNASYAWVTKSETHFTGGEIIAKP
jgi:LysM repeat protein